MENLNSSTTRGKGRWYEGRAEEYLQKRGYSTLQKNYLYGKYEIDLIMQKENTLVFIEVKYRKNDLYGKPYLFLSKRQKLNIITASVGFIRSNFQYRDCIYRFDVVSICGNNEVEHYPNAFSIDEFGFIKAL